MDPEEAVANFVAITGADEAAALAMLEATGYNLEAAVNLHFASGGEAGGGDVDMPAFEDDEALARRLQQEAQAGPAPPPLEDEVRAPLPVYKTERLYGDEVYRPAGQRRPANPVPQNVVDAFRDFKAEAGGGAGPSGTGGGGASLAAMFEPPREMLFQGGFEEAKEHAREQGRWLIVNLQSTSQFASHQMNRDTWRNEMVRALVENNFVLFQAYDVVEEGQKLLNFYKVLELPATLIIDPVTGAPMWQRTGFIDAERLTEELLPFLDHSIHDPGAARLARRSRSRRDLGRQPSKPLTEEEELQRALEMSMAEAGGVGGGGLARGGSSYGGSYGGTTSGGGASDMGDDFEDEDEEAGEEEPPPAAAAAAQPPAASPAQVQAAAEARLPPEPPGSEGVRIALRLPDGRRVQRRFPADATLAAVYDLCLAQSEEAADGRAFTLAQAGPGAAPLADRQQTLEAAALHGAMLVVKWD